MSAAASLDLRLPIGGLFTVLGVIIGGYGVATNGNAALYETSLSININLWWGLVMLVVGALMLAMGIRASRAARPSSALPASDTPEGRATERREHRSGLEQ
jgi:membrane protein implicated in regulation of membrane protease activity